jgi:TonB-dependent receptor
VVRPGSRALLCGSVLSLCSFVSAQQAGSIRGLVSDKDFDVPLGAAVVQIVETGQKTVTSDQGNFVLPDVPPGKYTLVFSKEGYVRQLAEIVVSSGQLAEVNIALSGDFTDLEEFVVQDVLQVASGSESALLQLRLESPAMIDAVGADLMSRAGASDAAGALRLVAGASVQDGKSAVIRGLPDRYVSSQMNGVRLPTANEDKRAVELDQFPTEVIESIQVSKTFTPDQQGDASGGAVDVRLKGIPDVPFFFKWKLQTKNNTQVTGSDSFRSYQGGGVHFWGHDGGDRAPQLDSLGDNWDGAVGSSPVAAPTDYKWSGALGGRFEIADGVKVGGFFSFFHEHESKLDRDGKDDSWWVESPGAPMTPKTVQGTVNDGDFKTSLFDVQRASQAVQWGTLSTLGLQTDNHSVNFVHLYTRTAEDKVTLAEDTRGKAYFFPGYDPTNQNSPGYFEFNAAPYLRLETLEYTERTTETLQLNGRHRLAASSFARNLAPELEWTVARSSATSNQPDKRQFGSIWTPGLDLGSISFPATYTPFKPSANFTLGNLQRIYKEIHEDSDQAAVNLKIPFEIRRGQKGYLKAGFFHDRVTRTFDQNTFSNFGDNTGSNGPWELPWSQTFPTENHPISESSLDVDYRGKQGIDATYAMFDMPLTRSLSMIGGVRFESTQISIVNDAEADATWLPPSTNVPTALQPGAADVSFSREDVLPSLSLVYVPVEGLTLRAAYSETVARQTFKELSPIQQQEYLGGPVFVGNPDLDMSDLKNYDLRADFSPREGSLLSLSWFRKDIKDPIEYVQRISSFDYTTAVNYPKGKLSGFEVEARQGLGHWWSAVDGLSVGANATFLDSSVQLPDDEIAAFSDPSIQAPMSSRDMTNTPDRLYNLFLTYDLALTGTQLGLFYTVQGDTLIAGAGESNGNFVPSVYAVQYDRLNFSFSQQLGPNMRLQFAAKNLTNPDRREVYRSDYIGDDVTKTSRSDGIEYSIGIGGEVRF